MAKIIYKYVPAPKTPERSIDYVQNQFLPLLNEYWENKGKLVFGEELQFSLIPFIQMWMLGSLIIIMAYEDNKPVGILMAVRFTPLMYSANVVQPEIWHAKNKDIENGLFQYLMNISDIQNINEIWVSSDVPGKANITWELKNTFTIKRFVKE